MNAPFRAWLSKVAKSLGRPYPEGEDRLLLAGLQLQSWTFSELLGFGGGGAVFAAIGPEGALAIKVLARGTEEEEILSAREIEIGRRLRHPNLVQIHGTTENDVARFVVMEHVGGGNLSEMLGEPWSTEQLLSIFGPLSDGLQYAHDHGVVHRDLKPDNVRVNKDGVVKVLDFGLAQLKGSQQLTMSGQFKGTPMHSSPEQIKSSLDVTPACDQFPYGLMVYEAVSGKFPYEVDPAKPILALFTRMEEPARPLRQLAPEQSPELEAVLAKMLAMEPEDRYPTIREAFAALQKAVQS